MNASGAERVTQPAVEPIRERSRAQGIRAPGIRPPGIRPLGADDATDVLALNQHWVPHVGPLDEAGLEVLLAEADLVLGAWLERGGVSDPDLDLQGEGLAVLAGFVILLAAGARYGSPNYRYFAGRHDRFSYVDRVAVAPGVHRLGVGSALYDAVVAHANSSRSPVVCAEVNLDPPNPGSQRFHSSYGFTEVGRQWTYDDTVEVQLLELAL